MPLVPKSAHGAQEPVREVGASLPGIDIAEEVTPPPTISDPSPNDETLEGQGYEDPIYPGQESPLPMAASPDALRIDSLMSFGDLEAAVAAASPGDIIEIPNDITLEATLSLSKSLTFKAVSGAPVTLTSQTGNRHMEIAGNGIETVFENVILAGGDVSGGIRLSGSDMTLRNASITRCYSPTVKTADGKGFLDAGGAVYIETGSSVTIVGGSFTYNKAIGAGGAVFVQDIASLNIGGNPLFSYNEATADRLKSATGSSDYSYCYGGAICCFGPTTTTTITDGVYSFNKAGSATPGGEGGGSATVVGGALFSNGTVIINGGSIVSNRVENTNSPFILNGGGVSARWVVLNAGEVSHNVVSGNAQLGMGGGGISSRTTSSKQSPSGKYVLDTDNTSYGVVVYNGSIKGNRVTGTAHAAGGGIHSYRVIMMGGTVSDNSVGTTSGGSRGGGISVSRPFGWFEMTGGEVCGNSAQFGGGLYFDCPTTYDTGEAYGICTISGTSLVKGNTGTTVGGGVAYYNEVMDVDFYPTISGFAKIIENEAPSGGGVLMFTGASRASYFSDIHLTIGGDTLIQGNRATAGYAGGVMAHMQRSGALTPNRLGDGFTLTIKDNSRISDNSAKTYAAGMLAAYAKIFLSDSARIDANEATTYAGGIYLFQSSLETSGNVRIDHNKAATLGGGIVFNVSDAAYADQAKLALSGDTGVTDNSASGGGGGGVYIQRAIWPRMDIGENVVFANNYAVTPYLITSDADIQAHDDYVRSTRFTKPFSYGFNNNDIYYVDGTPLSYHTVSFDTGGYAPAPDALHTVIIGSTIDSPDTKPVRDGYVFTGWYRDAATTQPWDFLADTVTEDATLYAGWRNAGIVYPLGPPDSTAQNVMPDTGDKIFPGTGILLLAGSGLVLAGVIMLLARRRSTRTTTGYPFD